MGKSWVGWLAFLVLATTIGVTSCQALWGPSGSASEQTE